MSLIFESNELIRQIECVKHYSKCQQLAFDTLVSGMVEIAQKYRESKEYKISDQLRSLLNSVGVQIIQGTGNIGWEECKKKYIDKGIPLPEVDDTYKYTYKYRDNFMLDYKE